MEWYLQQTPQSLLVALSASMGPALSEDVEAQPTGEKAAPPKVLAVEAA